MKSNIVKKIFNNSVSLTFKNYCMKKVFLSALAVICLSGISFCQQDSTNSNKAQKEQKKQTKGSSNKASKQKVKRQKVDSLNTNMDTTTRLETR